MFTPWDCPFLFLLLVLLFPSIAQQQQQQEQCGVSPLAIEKDQGNSSYPWAVAILYENWEAVLCTGTILNRRHILTAGHCVNFEAKNGEETKKFSAIKAARIVAGSPNVSIAGVKIVNASEAIRHPDYTDDHSGGGDLGDLAILRLEHPLEYGPTIRPICLDEKDAQEGEIGVITGWGRTRNQKECDTAGEAPTDTQMQGKMRIVDQKHCQVENGMNPMVPGKEICAKPYTAYTMHGDSGGPLMVRRADGLWYQVGIISYGSCHTRTTDQKRLPDIFTSVAHYRAWITENAMME